MSPAVLVACRGSLPGALLVAAALALSPGAADGQDRSAVELARQVAGTDGPVAFRVPIREGVRVCENGVSTGDDRRWGRWRDGSAGACSEGSALVALDVRDGRVSDLDLEPWLGGDGVARTLEATDGPLAAAYLLGLAGGSDGYRATGDAAEDAVMVSTLLAGVVVWPDLLGLARDREAREGVRRSAIFWLSQQAARRVAPALAEVAGDGSEAREIRDAAIFALSQRPDEESVPLLMELVREETDPQTRKRALFWLGQSDDPRVVDFFEEILVGG